MQPYVSIDIETLGLDPDYCHTIELAAVIDLDGVSPIEQLPTFQTYITRPTNQGEPYAMQMNANIMGIIAGLSEIELTNTTEQNAIKFFWNFLNNNKPKGEKRYTPAGKNYASFDKAFLMNLQGFKQLISPMLSHRTLDPGNLYWLPREDGFVLPDTKKCLERAGLEPTESHRALGDAIDVVRLIRHSMVNNQSTKCIKVETVPFPPGYLKAMDKIINKSSQENY